MSDKLCLDNIRILRGLACLGVILVHLGQLLDLNGVLRRITDFGTNGVYLFFIISALLSMLSLEKSFSKKYWLKRALKILPPYYFLILLSMALHELVIQDVPVDPSGLYWWRYLFLINYCIPAAEVFWNNLNAVWTVSVFVLFYIFAPFIKHFIKSYKQALILFAGLFIFGKIWWFITDWFKPIIYMSYFAIGIIIYYAIKEKKFNSAIALFSILSIGSLILKGPGNLSYAFIFSILLLSTHNCRIRSDFSQKVLALSDKYSYVLYLAHPIILMELERQNKAGRINNKLLLLFLFIAGTLVLSFITYRISVSGLRKLKWKSL